MTKPGGGGDGGVCKLVSRLLSVAADAEEVSQLTAFLRAPQNGANSFSRLDVDVLRSLKLRNVASGAYTVSKPTPLFIDLDKNTLVIALRGARDVPEAVFEATEASRRAILSQLKRSKHKFVCELHPHFISLALQTVHQSPMRLGTPISCESAATALSGCKRALLYTVPPPPIDTENEISRLCGSVASPSEAVASAHVSGWILAHPKPLFEADAQQVVDTLTCFEPAAVSGATPMRELPKPNCGDDKQRRSDDKQSEKAGKAQKTKKPKKAAASCRFVIDQAGVDREAKESDGVDSDGDGDSRHSDSDSPSMSDEDEDDEEDGEEDSEEDEEDDVSAPDDDESASQSDEAEMEIRPPKGGRCPKRACSSDEDSDAEAPAPARPAKRPVPAGKPAHIQRADLSKAIRLAAAAARSADAPPARACRIFDTADGLADRLAVFDQGAFSVRASFPIFEGLCTLVTELAAACATDTEASTVANRAAATQITRGALSTLSDTAMSVGDVRSTLVAALAQVDDALTTLKAGAIAAPTPKADPEAPGA